MNKKAYISIFEVIKLIEIIKKYRYSIKPLLICTDDKKMQKFLINYLKEFYTKENFKNELKYFIILNKKDYICKIRLQEFIENSSNTKLTKKLERHRLTDLSEIKWLKYKDKRKISVVKSLCFNCSEKHGCKYMNEIKKFKKCNYDFEFITTNQITNELLNNINFYESYSKVIFYKMKKEVIVTISKNEMLDVIHSFRPSKLNTAKKIEINRLCNKCEKEINILFKTIWSKERITDHLYKLILGLEKLVELQNNFKVEYLLNKVKQLKINNITEILAKKDDVKITFKIKL